MTSKFAQFHRNLVEVRKGTHFHKQDIYSLDDKLLHSYLLNLKNKDEIRLEIAKNTAQTLYFVRSYLSECGRLEQLGKQLIPEGKSNILLTCENGSNFERVPLLNTRDIMRMEVFKRGDGTLVVYGRKSLESFWFKLRSKDKTMLSPEYIPPDEAFAELAALREKLAGRMDLSPAERQERAADLARIEEILRQAQKTDDELRSGLDVQAQGRASKLVRKIESEVHDIKKAFKSDAAGVLSELDGLASAPLPHQANTAWPLDKAKATVIARVLEMHGGKGEHEALDEFITRYSDELNRNTVPAQLQPQMSEFLRLAKIAALYTIAKVSAYSNDSIGADEKAGTMGLRLREITQCVESISASAARLEELDGMFDSGRLSAGKDRAVAFAAVWEMGSLRKKIWQDLNNMKYSLKMLCTRKKNEQDGRDEYDLLSIMIPIAAAQNFARITKAEADLWKSFMDRCKPTIRRYLAEDSRNIEREIDHFMANAREGKLHQKKEANRGLKDVIYEHDIKILELLDQLRKADSMLAAALYEVFNDTKAHVLYKRGGAQILCPSLKFHLPPERQLIESAPEDARLAGMIARNSEFFGLAGKYGMSEVILQHLDFFNHFEPNALDSNPDYRKLVTAHSQGKDHVLPYRHYVEPHDGTNRVKIAVNAARMSHETYLPDSVPGYSPDQFDERTIDEILYGTKQPLQEYLSTIRPGRDKSDDSAKGAYDAIAGAYLESRADFLHIREMLENPNTYEFLASFSLKQRMLNGAIFIPKEGGIGYNDPLRVDGTNNLLETAGLTPEMAEYYRGRVDWYLKLSPARIMLHAMHSRKWEWAMECAEKIAKF